MFYLYNLLLSLLSFYPLYHILFPYQVEEVVESPPPDLDCKGHVQVRRRTTLVHNLVADCRYACVCRISVWTFFLFWYACVCKIILDFFIQVSLRFKNISWIFSLPGTPAFAKYLLDFVSLRYACDCKIFLGLFLNKVRLPLQNDVELFLFRYACDCKIILDFFLFRYACICFRVLCKIFLDFSSLRYCFCKIFFGLFSLTYACSWFKDVFRIFLNFFIFSKYACVWLKDILKIFLAHSADPTLHYWCRCPSPLPLP